MFTLSEGITERLMQAKVQYAVYTRTVKMARKCGRDEVELRPIEDLRMDTGNTLNRIHNEILTEMKLYDTNMCVLKDCWRAVAVLEKKAKISIAVEPLKNDDIILLKRRRPIPRADYDRHISTMMDMEELTIYKNKLNSLIASMLQDTFGIDYTADEVIAEDKQFISKVVNKPSEATVLDNQVAEPVKPVVVEYLPNFRMPEANGTPGITDHAMERYIERVEGITDQGEVQLKMRLYEREYSEAIKKAWRESTLEHQEEDTRWYFNRKLLLFFIVVGHHMGDSAIVTVYQKEFEQTKDFSFSAELDKSIILKQLKLIRKLKVSYEKAKEKHGAIITSIDTDIARLKAEQEQIRHEVESLELAKSANSIIIVKEGTALSKELSRVFYKKWLKAFSLKRALGGGSQ